MSATTLFDDVQTWPPPFGEWCNIPKRTQSADLYSYAGQKLMGYPAAWRWHTLKAVEPDGTLITGAVPIGTTKSGNVKWPKASEDRTLVVKSAELKALAAQWSVEHGLCYRCGGDGVQWTATSVDKGWKYKPCDICTPQAHDGGNG